MVSCLAGPVDCAVRKNAGNSRSSSAMRRGISKMMKRQQGGMQNAPSPTAPSVRSKRGVPAFLQHLLQTKDFTRFDPWVTQRFPLGHPEISTGSPKVFHRVTQATNLLKSRMPQTETPRCGDTEMILAKKRRIFKNKTRGKSEKVAELRPLIKTQNERNMQQLC